jgi:thiol-disulfide isomerase/thioredoxin
MKKKLIEACAFMLLLVACTTLVFGLAGCKPKLSTDTEVTAPAPRVNDTAQRIIDDTQPPPPDRSWVTWTECSQKPGNHPCNFSLMDQYEQMVDLYDFHEKVIVVDLSSIWCGVCQNIATKGEDFVADYGAENVIWITILVDGLSYGVPPSLADIQAWANNYSILGPVLMGDRSLVDLNAETGYPVTGWPTLVVIDQNMVLQYGINGWNEATIRGWVESLL